jgi:outer membrane biosynthesis protein TonB
MQVFFSAWAGSESLRHNGKCAVHCTPAAFRIDDPDPVGSKSLSVPKIGTVGLAVVAIAIWFATAAQAEAYKCVAQDGKQTFQDTPCAKTDTESKVAVESSQISRSAGINTSRPLIMSKGGGPSRQWTGPRTQEEVDDVFDRYRGAIYAFYARALRQDKDLKGQLVLTLTIAGGGAVTDCRVVSSELKNADFERQLVARIKILSFDARNVAPFTTTRTLDFFPAN